METDETTTGSVPAWLEPDDTENIPPAALRAIYGQLDQAVTQACERARKGMRDGYVRGLLEVRDALAPSGLFKAWCEAAGINYETARSIVKRADKATRAKPDPNPEQPSVGASDPRPPATPGPDEADGPDDTLADDAPAGDAGGAAEGIDKPKKEPRLWFSFASEDAQRRAFACIGRVMDARNLDRGAALLYILDTFDKLTLAADAAQPLQAQATPATVAA